MESAMKKAEFQKRVKDFEAEFDLRNRENELNRARSITVGTALGGSTEIMMRGNSGFMWLILQPVEVVELINQMAAGIGCHIAIKPRKDFASWRGWELDAPWNVSGNGWPPFADEITPHAHRAAKPPSLEEQPGLLKPELRSKENVMAIEKPKNRRSSKRTAKAA
jgi:hypothetical protein